MYCSRDIVYIPFSTVSVSFTVGSSVVGAGSLPRRITRLPLPKLSLTLVIEKFIPGQVGPVCK